MAAQSRGSARDGSAYWRGPECAPAHPLGNLIYFGSGLGLEYRAWEIGAAPSAWRQAWDSPDEADLTITQPISARTCLKLGPCWLKSARCSGGVVSVALAAY